MQKQKTHGISEVHMRSMHDRNTLTSLKSVPGSVPGKERLCRCLRVPRKERQSRSCHGTGKIKKYYFFFPGGKGYFRMVGFSTRVKIVGTSTIDTF